MMTADEKFKLLHALVKLRTSLRCATLSKKKARKLC
jgi:hypothetical protein